MSLTSTTTIARPGSKSLRTTIPEGIVAFLDLEKKDELVWRMEFIDNERIVIVRKRKNDDAEKIALKYVRQT